MLRFQVCSQAVYLLLALGGQIERHTLSTAIFSKTCYALLTSTTTSTPFPTQELDRLRQEEWVLTKQSYMSPPERNLA
jgi:hypothetical protein